MNGNNGGMPGWGPGCEEIDDGEGEEPYRVFRVHVGRDW